jgi:regulator of replication initiation timing
MPLILTQNSDLNQQITVEYQVQHEKIQNLNDSTMGEYQQIQDLQVKILHIIEEIRLLRDENADLSEVTELKSYITDLEIQMRSLLDL